MYDRTTKRRGGARDDSTLNIGLNRRELDELLERIRRKLQKIIKITERNNHECTII